MGAGLVNGADLLDGTATLADGVIASWWQTALLIVWAVGALVMLVRLCFAIGSVQRIIQRGTVVETLDGFNVVVVSSECAPFSWRRNIVLSQEDYNDNPTLIIAHEKAHCQQHHSRDMILVDLVLALQWFNPVLWMLRSDLRALHEYQADDRVLRQGVNIREYQYLLIRKAVSSSGYSVANNLNHSTLKNRITMMSTSKSSRTRGLKILYILPLVGIALVAQAQTKVDYKFTAPAPKIQNEVPNAHVEVRNRQDGVPNAQVEVPNPQVEVEGTLVVGQDTIVVKGTAPEKIAQLRQLADSIQIADSLDLGKVKLKMEGQPIVLRLASPGKNPLCIVDGKKITVEELNKIDVNTIESITVLKDSAALKIYGEEGVNGVVVVSFKKEQ